MANGSLVGFINHQLEGGIDELTIRSVLLDAGYSAREIGEAFQAIDFYSLDKKPSDQEAADLAKPDSFESPSSQQEQALPAVVKNKLKEEKQAAEAKKEIKLPYVRPEIKDEGNYREPIRRQDLYSADKSGASAADKALETAPAFPSRPLKLRFKAPGLKTSNKPIIFGLVFFAATVAAGFFGFVYPRYLQRNPFVLAPQNTPFLVRINIDKDDKQVEQFMALMDRVPGFEALSQSAINQFSKILEENNPGLKEMAPAFAKEIIFVSGEEARGNLFSADSFIIFSKPNLAKLRKMSAELEKLDQKENWDVSKVSYKGRRIYEIKSPLANSYYKQTQNQEGQYVFQPIIQQELAVCFTNGQLVFAERVAAMKEIIDLGADQEPLSLFKKTRQQSLRANDDWGRLKKYLPSRYLVQIYGRFVWLDAFSPQGIWPALMVGDSQKESQDAFLRNNLQAVVYPDFYSVPKPPEEKNSITENLAFVSAITAQENGLKIERYVWDTRQGKVVPDAFALNESLAKLIPLQSKDKRPFYYFENYNLSKLWDQLTDFSDELRGDNFGFNFEKITPLFDKNYSFSFFGDQTGKNLGAFIFTAKTNEPQKIIDVFSEIEVKDYSRFKQEISGPYYSYWSLIEEENLPVKGFVRETVNGHQIYSLEFYSLGTKMDVSWAFAFKDDLFILCSGKKNLLEYLDSLNGETLGSAVIFQSHLEAAPRKVYNLFYINPYAALGTTEYVFNHAYSALVFIFMPDDPQIKQAFDEMVSEIFERGISPYAKTLESLGSFSYLTAEGVMVTELELSIKELPQEEKKQAEDFWLNFETWSQEKIESIFGFDPTDFEDADPSFRGLPMY